MLVELLLQKDRQALQRKIRWKQGPSSIQTYLIQNKAINTVYVNRWVASPSGIHSMVSFTVYKLFNSKSVRGKIEMKFRQ